MKGKKTLVALVALLLIGVVGGTWAYFTAEASFDNVFKTQKFSADFTEDFVSPEDWTPGTTTKKEVYATNTGDVPVAVRVSYTEKWVSENGTELSLTQGENQVALINLTNTSDWEKVGNYYVYKHILAKGEKTLSFMDSVTFNENVTASSSVNCTTEQNGSITTKKCTSSGYGYDGATYTLNVKIEVIQSDVAETEWNLTENFFSA